MLSNVTKSADVLRGATEMQDLWMEIVEAYPVADLKGPRRLTNAIMNGLVMNEKEAADELERITRVRQQRTNFYMSDSAKALKARKSRMPASERKEINERLAKPSVASPPRGKATTGQGFLMNDGDWAPNSPPKQPPSAVKTPKSRGGGIEVSPPGTDMTTSKQRQRAKFEGLTMREFYNKEWHPSFEYRPATHPEPYKPVDGFSVSTRTLERRKMDPFLDINSYTGNFASAKAQFNSHAHVRPLDCKGNLGALPVQQWKESLREDFARDDDNFSSNAHDQGLDALREVMGIGKDRFASDID